MQKGLGIELRFARLFRLRFGYFEDIPGQRGGILIEDSLYHTSHISLLRYLTKPVPNKGRAKISGFCWGVGIEWNGVKVDAGIDEQIYDFPTPNLRFQISCRFH